MLTSQGIPPGRTRKPPLQERARPPPSSAPPPFGTVAFVTTTPRIVMLTKNFPFLLPCNVGIAIPATLRRLADDMDRIRAGTGPTAEELANAPLIVDWRCVLTPVGLSLAGFVAGHPLLGNRPARTSQLWVADAGACWVRTLSRYYKLGISSDRTPFDGVDATEGGGGRDE
jgi:hypothetical protein